jgi:hypothetical protein
MLEYIQFYTKNLSNFTILLLIGVVIAILDITLRNVIKDVYLNVRENMRLRHGGGGDGSSETGGEREGMENKGTATTSKEDEESCPKDCSAVEALRTKLTGLIENAAKLQKDIKANNDMIKYQHKVIENMQKSVQKLIEKSK